MSMEVRKKGKDQESIQSSATPDPGYQWEFTTPHLDITNESQEVSPFPAGDQVCFEYYPRCSFLQF